MTRKDRQGLCTIIFVGSVFLTLFVLNYYLSASADQYDQETLCRMDGKYRTVKVLVDKTDPWNGQEKERLAALIRRIKGQLAENERLAIHVLDETGTYSTAPVFDLCNPGRKDQANSLYENPRKVQKRFEDRFQTPLDNVLADLLRPGVAPQSPILESLIALKGVSGQQERLILVSDMMQNSDALTFYRKDGLDQSRQAVGQGCNLANLYESIEGHVINRPSIAGSSRQETRNFWEGCLRRMSEHDSTWQAL